jgi:hypothetical protein
MLMSFWKYSIKTLPMLRKNPLEPSWLALLIRLYYKQISLTEIPIEAIFWIEDIKRVSMVEINLQR